MFSYFVADGLPIKENLLLQELEEARWKELEVLDVWLLGGTWSLRRFGLADPQGFSEVGVHGVVGLPFPLGRLNPVGNDLDNEKTLLEHIYTHLYFFLYICT